MSGLMEGLLKRRSVRAYKPDMVPQEAIDKILEAGTMRLRAAAGSRPLSLRSPIRKCGISFPQ